MNKLIEKLSQFPLMQHPHNSRVHRLRSIGTENLTCYVKREDELGFGISGCKLRKYLSLLPAILKEGVEKAVVIGSAHSSHVLSLSQLLIENGVEPLFFLLGDPKCTLQGNYLLTSLFAKEENIHWFPKKSWQEIEEIAREYAKKIEKCAVISMGANCKEALPGALTLATDILRNEAELGFEFDHIFIDAGTGMTASALLLAFSYFQKKCTIHVVQVAGDQKEFVELLELRRKDLESWLDEPLPSPAGFQLYTPSSAPAFGSVNAAIFKTIVEIGRTEGFLTDPVFTAKLFNEGERIIRRSSMQGTALFIHSGGGLGLMGFQSPIAKAVKRTRKSTEPEFETTS